MPNGFLFSLKLQDGTPLQIDSAGRDGVVIRNEFDATPRLTELQFKAADPITEREVARVRRDNGWKLHEFHLLCFVNSAGLLGFKEVAPGFLPSGTYFTRLTIEDLKLPKKAIKFKISEVAPSVLGLEAIEDPRRIELLQDVKTFDGVISRIMLNRMSRLDGADVKTWLMNPTRRPRRKACLLNIFAKLRSIDDRTGVGITNTIRHIFFADIDRIYVATTNRFVQLLAKHFKPGGPIHRTHEELPRFAKMKHPDLQVGPLMNFREAQNQGLQVVTCAAVKDGKVVGQYADIDIDLGNPSVDLKGLIVHAGELLIRGRTDHMKLWKKLTKDNNIAKYLPYRVLPF